MIDLRLSDKVTDEREKKECWLAGLCGWGLKLAVITTPVTVTN